MGFHRESEGSSTLEKGGGSTLGLEARSFLSITKEQTEKGSIELETGSVYRILCTIWNQCACLPA